MFIGTFNSTLTVDVFGEVSNGEYILKTIDRVISSMDIKMKGSSDPVLIKKKAVFNPGKYLCFSGLRI